MTPSAGAFVGREHQLAVRVYYEDTDFSGVVYHANYLRFFERGRTDALRLAGVHHTELLADQAARKMGVNLDPSGAEEIAARARGTPRVAGRLLRRVRDFASAEGASVIDRGEAGRALARLEVDEVGLDSLDRRYLRVLIENYGGGPTGADTLAYAIAEARDAVEDVIEPFLLQQGFIQRTPRGRMACAKAYAHLGLVAPKSANLPPTADLFDD